MRAVTGLFGGLGSRDKMARSYQVAALASIFFRCVSAEDEDEKDETMRSSAWRGIYSSSVFLIIVALVLITVTFDVVKLGWMVTPFTFLSLPS